MLYKVSFFVVLRVFSHSPSLAHLDQLDHGGIDEVIPPAVLPKEREHGRQEIVLHQVPASHDTGELGKKR